MRGVRGANKQPGEIRPSQNWICGTRPGNAVFVPAPPEELPALLTNFENYLHAENGLPRWCVLGWRTFSSRPSIPTSMVMAASVAAHYTAARALEAAVPPLLYLSLFFKRHRAEYYRLLVKFE